VTPQDTSRAADTDRQGGRPDAERLRELVQSSLDDDEAVDIVTIDLAGKTTFADYMIIASGESSRHVSAIAEHLLRKVKQAGVRVRAEGANACDWVLVDAGDIVVHIFRPEVRSFYNVEKMWGVEASETAATASA